MSKLVRLKPFNPKRGFTLRTYTLGNTRFTQGTTWYRVSDDVAKYLSTVTTNDADPDSPYAFQVCTEEEAAALDAAERESALSALQRGSAPAHVDAVPKRTHEARAKRREPEAAEGVLTTADLPGRRDALATPKAPPPVQARVALDDASDDGDEAFNKAYSDPEDDGDADAQIEALRHATPETSTPVKRAGRAR